ncbi:MAG: heavy-metal-associated domain-containing protein [Ruminiclostridium sp.]|nr:heavy-metal-associated domain-containing protein [Ruminiclostridium sp.]MBQ8842946.1 heavy-metal-associated domain-containing protein [Ruminiclostridium sp.]
MKKIYKMTDLECANCAAKMERQISELDGVESVNISFMLQKMTIVTDDDRHNEIMKQAAKICKKIEPDCVINM